jgi:hypothetical protein
MRKKLPQELVSSTCHSGRIHRIAGRTNGWTAMAIAGEFGNEVRRELFS